MNYRDLSNSTSRGLYQVLAIAHVYGEVLYQLVYLPTAAAD